MDDGEQVRLITPDRNLGPGFARNLAIKEADGDWIAVLDADDSFDPDRLRCLVGFAERKGADIVSDNLAICDPTGAPTGSVMFPRTWLEAERPLTAESFVLGNIGARGKPRLAYGFLKPIFRRNFLTRHKLGYELSRFAEDYFLGLQCLIAGALWLTVPEALYHYTVGDGTLTTQRADADLRALIDSERALLTTRAVNADPNLRRALRRHLLSVEKAKVWNAFAQSLKRNDFKTAIGVGTSHPRFAPHLVSETSRLALHLVGKAMGRPT